MTPIIITQDIQELSDMELAARLNLYSKELWITKDFEKVNLSLFEKLEQVATEAITRIAYDKLKVIYPLQNKIYEYVEKTFESDERDIYNINRTFSALRRSKVTGVDHENIKYQLWLKNRVKFGFKTLAKELKHAKTI